VPIIAWNTHAWLKALGDNPRLHLSRPAPLASPPRLNDLAPTNKSIATICHAKPPSANADLLAGASRIRNRSIQWVGTAAYDELGFVPLSKTGAELLFELISQRYERGATLITSNLPFDEWTETFGSERLTGALLDRLTHHVNILEMNGESYRLGQSKARQDKA
jgi:hypothetical protein